MPSGGRKGYDATSPVRAPVTLGRCFVRLPEGGRSCGRVSSAVSRNTAMLSIRDNRRATHQPGQRNQDRTDLPQLAESRRETQNLFRLKVRSIQIVPST
jgi:hypothetical protein